MKSALKPKAGATKKEEKRRAKKEKLNRELTEKEEAKEEARKEAERERYEAAIIPEEEQPVTMGNEFRALLGQFSMRKAATGGGAPREKKRSKKQIDRAAIENAKAMLSSAQFQSDPTSAFTAVNEVLVDKITQN